MSPPTIPNDIYERLFENMVQAGFLHQRGHILLVNRAAREMLGYSDEELRGMHITDIEVESDPEALQRMWKELEANPSRPASLTGTHRRKDGSVFPVEVHSSRFHLDGQVVTIAMVQDISERLRLQQEVAERTAELETALSRSQAILDNMDDGLISITPDGRVDLSNPAFKRLYTAEQTLHGELIHDALHADLAALVHESLASDTVQRGEVALPNDRIGAAAASAIRSGDRLLGAVVLVRDVTIERELESMKSEFTQMVTHELRTPMTSVLGFAKITRHRLDTIFSHVPEDDKKANRAMRQVRENIDIIVEEGTRLTALINDVLDFAKMEAGHLSLQLQSIAPGLIVDRAMTTAHSLFSGDVAFERAVHDGLPDIVADAARLQQVVLNLVSNAQKFTTEGSVTVGARAIDGGVEFSVTDTGCGIPETQLEGIFEKFRQVDGQAAGGTGLGLPICREIIRGHNGRIWATSEVDRGSRFAFWVPLDAGDV